MDIKLANEIIACLPKERTLFPYYEDRYAVMLLERLAGEGIAIADIKSSGFGKLLSRPLIKRLVATKGDGWLSYGDLLTIPASDVEHYVLTLGLWGSAHGRANWCQTSRRGVNLVLQLNFSRKHDRLYRKLVDPQDCKPFVMDCHPVCTRGRNTLAWARIDLDWQNGEALVEEVQNDWLRDAEFYLRTARHLLTSNRGLRSTIHVGFQNEVRAIDVVTYVEKVLKLHRRVWSEAMLAAAIWFLCDEIGIHRIWYHDHDTGARLKKIDQVKPPRSLYTDLPKRFCFERTCKAPEFILERATRPFKRDLNAAKEHFWRLNL
ncbi:MAG: hypothetical protein ACR2OM_04145 [Aestuariivirgaceae bacterium]